LALSRPRPGTYLLSGMLPTTNWSASLLLAAQADDASVSLPWPAGANGAPQRELSVARECWPVGTIKVCALVLNGARLTIVQLPDHAALLPLEAASA
ncbi:MAG TPA: hypothetical protein VFQ76_02410, partial [Longimicrobiaceae bacterium]|nr:hypothetical protein [Longimicrobiaceae bacterium]